MASSSRLPDALKTLALGYCDAMVETLITTLKWGMTIY
jgi:hypothetical protein